MMFKDFVKSGWFPMILLILLSAVTIVVSGCAPMGGCYPGKFKSLSSSPECLKVAPGCVGRRIEISNTCNQDVISSNYELGADVNSVWYTSISGSVKNLHVNISKASNQCNYSGIGLKNTVTEEDILSMSCNNLYIPKGHKTIIDGTKINFEISNNDVKILGEWE